MFFRRRAGTSHIKNTWIEDITISGKSKVLSLRPTYFVIRIDKQKIRELFSKDKYFIGYGLVVLIVLAVSSLSNPTKADVVNFYPTSCLGGWENPENATGAPSLDKDENLESFNEENSARMRGTSDIFCGGFEGEIPPEAVANSFSLSFRISVDDGSVEHKKTEVLVVPETEEVRVGTDNIELIEIESSDTENQSIDPTENQEVSIEQDSTNTAETEEVSIPESEIPTEDVQVEAPAQESPEPENSPESTPDTTESSGESAFLRFFTRRVHAEGEVVTDLEVAEDIVSPQVEEAPAQDTISIEESVVDEQSAVENQTSEQIDTGLEEVINIDRSSSENDEIDSSVSEDGNTGDLAEVVPNDAILKIIYTLDGEKWVSLGYISMSSWKDLKFSIPLTDWSSVSSFQIKLEQISSYDERPVVFLDSIILSAEYDGLGEDPIRQPDFGTDVILYDKTVDDIRVIKILRNDIPMIWYTKIPPPVDLPEGKILEEQDGVEIIMATDDTPIVDTETPTDSSGEGDVTLPVEEPASEVLPTETIPENQDTNSTEEGAEIISFVRKIKNIFGVLQVYAEGEEGGASDGGSSDSGGGDSSSQGGDSSSTTSENGSDSSSSESSSSESNSSSGAEESVSSIDPTDTNNSENSVTEDSLVEENNSVVSESDITTDNQVSDSINKVLDDINIGEGGNIIIDTINKYDNSDIKITEDLLLSTTEEIIPGLTPILYTEEQIMEERASGVEWNLVAVGESIDTSTPVDVSGGIIFWFGPGKSVIYQYNTASGGISSEGVSVTTDSEVKYLEPNGDVSEVSIDIQDSEIITPKEEIERQEAILESENSQTNIIDTVDI